MKDDLSIKMDRRQEILAQIGQVPRIIDGTLSQRVRKRGGAKAKVYHQLQRWRRGHNDTKHIPAERVDAVREGIEGYQRVQVLIGELARVDEQTVLGDGQPSGKKKPTRR